MKTLKIQQPFNCITQLTVYKGNYLKISQIHTKT